MNLPYSRFEINEVDNGEVENDENGAGIDISMAAVI